MTLDNLLADRQADARAGVFATGMQPLEDDEDTVELLLLDPNPVVLHAEAPFPFSTLG